jgi:hypothetical protein
MYCPLPVFFLYISAAISALIMCGNAMKSVYAPKGTAGSLSGQPVISEKPDSDTPAIPCPGMLL